MKDNAFDDCTSLENIVLPIYTWDGIITDGIITPEDLIEHRTSQPSDSVESKDSNVKCTDGDCPSFSMKDIVLPTYTWDRVLPDSLKSNDGYCMVNGTSIDFDDYSR